MKQTKLHYIRDLAGIDRRNLLKFAGLSIVVSTQQLQAKNDDRVATFASNQDFLRFSRFATDHDALDETLGSALFNALKKKDPSFQQRFDDLVRKFSARAYPSVEVFEENLRGDPTHTTLLAIIRAWYSGTVGEGLETRVYAFETALMYQPPKDVVVIPTFAFDGPNYWVREPASVDIVPNF